MVYCHPLLLKMWNILLIMSENTSSKKIAIILFNPGGPDKLSSVRRFLFNLFSDKNIVNIPGIFRWFFAWYMSFKREQTAQKIYSHIGGKSPLLKKTEKQAEALRKSISKTIETNFEAFISMRYWHPMSDEVIMKLKKYSLDEVILLPLYPQLSTATTFSSISDFTAKMDKKMKKDVVRKVICCYPTEQSFIKEYVDLISNELKKIKDKKNIEYYFLLMGYQKE